jgi:hypothetical protein
MADAAMFGDLSTNVQAMVHLKMPRFVFSSVYLDPSGKRGPAGIRGFCPSPWSARQYRIPFQWRSETRCSDCRRIPRHWMTSQRTISSQSLRTWRGANDSG